MLNHISEFYAKNWQKLRESTLLLIAVSLAIAAQLILSFSIKQPGFWNINTWWSNINSNSSPLPGLGLYFLAGIIFILALRNSENNPTRFTITTTPLELRGPRFGFWATSIGLACLTAFFTANSPATTYALAFGIVSFISILLLVISVFLDEGRLLPSIQKIQQWLNTHKAELFVIFTILIAAFFIRFLDLEFHPYSFINDEGEIGINGSCLMQGTCIEIFDSGWSKQPMLAFLPTGLSVSLFGNTALAVRLVSAVIGTLTVLAVYLFTREVFNKTTAWVAALLITTLPVHVHFSRIGVNNIVDSLSTTLMMWLLFRGVKHRSALYFLAGGILGGLCFYTYAGSRLAPVLGLLAIGIIGLQTRGFLQAQGRNFLIFLLALFITAAPIFGFFYQKPDALLGRMNQVGIFENNALQNEANNNSTSVLAVLTNHFMKSSLVFIATNAPSNFYNSPNPYLIPLAAIFFMLGLAYTLWRIRDPRYFMLFIWFWAAIILGSTITGGPPTSQRMLMSTSALAIITGIGITKTTDNIQLGDKIINRWFAPICLLVFVLFVGYQNISFYFGEYRIGHFFEDPTNELTYETHTLISPLHTDGRFYLICDPDIPYLSFASFDFFSPDVEKKYFYEVSPQALALLPNDKDALFVATADRKLEVEKLTQLIPGGEWSEFKRRNQPSETLFYSYKIKKSALQNFKP